MNELEIDTAKIDELGNSIKDEIDNLYTIYQNTIDLLLTIRDNNYWCGPSANAFFRKLDKDNREYIRFFNSLNRFGNVYSTISLRFETMVNNFKE